MMPDQIPEHTVRAAGAAWAERVAAAAQAAGVEMGLILDAPEARRTADLFAEVWAVGDWAPAHLRRSHPGPGIHRQLCGRGVGRRRPGRRLRRLSGPGQRAPLAALPRHRRGPARPGRACWFALKQHQRAWALSQGIREVTWTFDPLVRGNARFNLVKLGAVAVSYLARLLRRDGGRSQRR